MSGHDIVCASKLYTHLERELCLPGFGSQTEQQSGVWRRAMFGSVRQPTSRGRKVSSTRMPEMRFILYFPECNYITIKFCLLAYATTAKKITNIPNMLAPTTHLNMYPL